MAKKPNDRSSIYLGNDGYWHGWVTVGIKPDGSPDRRHRMAKTEAEVTRKVAELEGKRATGQVTKPGRVPTVAEWMTEYLDVICERLVASGKMTPRTLADYRSKTRHGITPLLGRHRLNRLAPEHLDTAYTTMLDKGLSTSTVLKVHRIISRALKVAVRRDKVTRNVATLVEAPTAAETEIEPRSAYRRDAPHRAGCEHPRRTAGSRSHPRDDHRALHPRIHTTDARCGGTTRVRSLGKPVAVATRTATMTSLKIKEALSPYSGRGPLTCGGSGI